VQNLAWFWTTLHFDRERLRKGWRYRKIGKLGNRRWYLLHFMNLVNFGPLPTRLEMRVWTHPKSTFWKTIFLPRGCCPLKFLHVLDNGQDLLTHTPLGMGSLNTFLQWNFKNWPKIYRMCANNFGARWELPHETVHMAFHKAGMRVWVQLFRAHTLKLARAKNVQNSMWFGTNLDFDHEYPRNGLTYRKSEKQVINCNPSHAGCEWNNLVNVAPLTKKIQACMFTHPRSTLRVLCRLTRLRLAHVTWLGAEFQSPKLSSQLDLWHQATSCWALPQISSYFNFFFIFVFVLVD